MVRVYNLLWGGYRNSGKFLFWPIITEIGVAGSENRSATRCQARCAHFHPYLSFCVCARRFLTLSRSFLAARCITSCEMLCY
jgi:hypothetical protein